MSLPIRAVTFDVGGTLIEPWPSVGHVYAAAAHDCGGPKADPAQLNAAFGVSWKKRHAFDHSKSGWRELVDETFVAIGLTPPTGCFELIYERFAYPDTWRVFGDVRPVLTELQRREIPVAFVSNWDERLHPLLQRLELSSLASAIVVSMDIGWRKPSLEIFGHAVRKLGLKPNEVLHVGDSHEADYRGALAAGLQARWLNRSAPDGEKENRISSLERILDAVAFGTR